MTGYEQLREKYGEIIAKKKFKIWYDKKLGNLRAKVEVIQENGIDVDYRPIGIDAINKLLYSFLELKGMSLKQLVDAKQVTLDELAGLGYEFDYTSGKLVEKRFTMADRIKLAEMEKKATVVTPKTTPIETPKEKPVVVPVVAPVEEKDEVIVPVEEKKEVVVPVETKEVKEEVTKEEKKEEIKEVKVSEDGAADVIVSESSKEDKEKTKKSVKGIKNLKVKGKTALAILVSGVIICYGLPKAIKALSTRNNNGSNDTRIEQEYTGNDYEHNDGIIYNEPVSPEEETLYVPYESSNDSYADYNSRSYESLGSVIEMDDMETQIQAILDTCFNYQPCSLENLVVESDRNAIRVLNNMRNNVLTGNCAPEIYLNNIVNYVFESGTIVDGTVIKSFDSLSPYAQYIVMASVQSILQNYPGYEHTTSQNSYNKAMLTNSFEYMLNDTYTYLISSAKTR